MAESLNEDSCNLLRPRCKRCEMRASRSRLQIEISTQLSAQFFQRSKLRTTRLYKGILRRLSEILPECVRITIRIIVLYFHNSSWTSCERMSPCIFVCTSATKTSRNESERTSPLRERFPLSGTVLITWLLCPLWSHFDDRTISSREAIKFIFSGKENTLIAAKLHCHDSPINHAIHMQIVLISCHRPICHSAHAHKNVQDHSDSESFFFVSLSPLSQSIKKILKFVCSCSNSAF